MVYRTRNVASARLGWRNITYQVHITFIVHLSYHKYFMSILCLICISKHVLLKLRILLYIYVTVHCRRFLFINKPQALIIQILFCHKTIHVSGIFSAHHQEFSTGHSALVYIMQVLMTASQQSHDGHTDSTWKRSSKPA